MAEYIPGTSVTRSAAMSALHHAKATDDNDVESRNSVMNVDYLSHNWEEEADVWASWRYTTKNKNDIAHGVRLENASWRTWWKQRNRLKTVSPETLNWLKDSDVTWLYGPLHTAADPVPTPKQATTVDRLGLVKVVGKKPILKHRSISELLVGSPRAQSPSLESAANAMHQNGEERPPLLQTKSEPQIPKTSSRKISPPRVVSLGGGLARSDSSSSRHVGSDNESLGQKKHISFNTFVEQYIAVDKPRSSGSVGESLLWSSSEPMYDQERDDEYDEEEGSLLTMRSSSSSGGSSRPPSVRRPTLERHTSTLSEKEHYTIAPIPPTILKTVDYDGDGECPAVVFVPPVGSPFVEDPGSFSRYSGNATLHLEGSTTFPSRGLGIFWDVEEADGGGGLYLGSSNHSSQGSSLGFRSPGATSDGPPMPDDLVHSLPLGRGAAQRYSSPGRSILRNGGNTDFEAAMRETVHVPLNTPDSYFSANPSVVPTPCIAKTPESATVPRSVSNGNMQHTSMPISLHPPVEVSRGRSAVRTAANIESRERSSSKGNSPIGSVSPTPSRPASTSRKHSSGPVYVGMNKESKDLIVPATHVDVYWLPPRPADASRHDVLVTSPSQIDNHGSISSNSIENPPFSGGSETVKPSGEVGVAGSGTTTTTTTTTYKASRAVPSQIDSRLIEDVDAVDGSDGYLYHSTNPTPTNSPTLPITSLPPSASTPTNSKLQSSFTVPAVAGDHRIVSSGSKRLVHRSNRSSIGDGTCSVARSSNSPLSLGGGGNVEEGTLVSRAAEIVNSARGLLGAIWGAGAGATASPIESYPTATGRKASDR